MKSNKTLKLAILSISFLLMLRLTISPALAEIGKAFPEVNQGTLMNMVILASVMAIPFGFISGILANFMKKKTILYIGFIFYIIGGLGPMFAPTFNMVLFFRALLGVGTGLFLPFAAGLIADFFQGEEREKMIGYQSTAVALGNIITSILAGVLATINWRLSFLIYAFAVITLILVASKMPEPLKIEKQKEQGGMVNRKMMFVCGAIFIYAIIYYAFFGYLAFVVDSKGLGNAASTGLATMVMTAVSMIAGIFYAQFVRRLGKAALPFILVVNVVGYYLLSIAGSFSMIVISAVFIGLGFGLLMPYGTSKVTKAAPPAAAVFANGLYMTAVNLGTAVSPTILIAVGKGFNNPDGQFIFFCCSVALALGLIISILLTLGTKKLKTEKAGS
ncbi:MFS transporter [Anoxybacterium hadale]|uniref:MFS transporter n=1 Tax=Anoxybacterium hadale TaxID=3408580 RepID=A0ACD1AF41_9FIRM|nr:MFS transporter [Clostridiales bacterium]